MARSLSQTIITRMILTKPLPAAPAPHHRLVNSRARSSVPEKNPKNRPQFEDPEAETNTIITIQKVEDEVHNVVARRVQPLWLPLVPGGSFWVPPPTKEKGFVDLIEKLVGSSSLIEAKGGATTTSGNRRCWPSSEYFFKGE